MEAKDPIYERYLSRHLRARRGAALLAGLLVLVTNALAVWATHLDLAAGVTRALLIGHGVSMMLFVVALIYWRSLAAKMRR